MWAPRVGVSVGSRRLGSRIDDGVCLDGLAGRDRRGKISLQSSNRIEVKEIKQKVMKVIKKTDSVSIRFPVFPFFELDMECAQRIGIEAITSSKDRRDMSISSGMHHKQIDNENMRPLVVTITGQG